MGKSPKIEPRKSWRRGEAEDKLIIKLIKSGKGPKDLEYRELKKNYPELFKNYSAQVIRNHVSTLLAEHRRKGNLHQFNQHQFYFDSFFVFRLRIGK